MSKNSNKKEKISNLIITDEKVSKINQIIQYNNLYSNYLNKNNKEFEKIKKFIENEGKLIYNKNDFFKDLHNLMKNEEFKTFYNKYFNSWFDIELMMMYMKLYETIETTYKLKFNETIPYELILFMLREIIRNNETRKTVVDNFELFKKGIMNNFNYNKLKKIKKLKLKFDKDIEKLKNK